MTMYRPKPRDCGKTWFSGGVQHRCGRTIPPGQTRHGAHCECGMFHDQKNRCKNVKTW